jgi:site-specific DNA-cytosine methylase
MFEQVNNKAKPTDDPLYQFVLEEIEGGMSHTDYVKKTEKTHNPFDAIEKAGIKYNAVAKWMDSKGYERQAAKSRRIHEKLESGGNIMRKGVEIGKNYIGAFVGHNPTSLVHPDIDRFINTREALDIMKMPKDFELQGGIKNLNMICQNVPVTTAMDMAENVKAFLGSSIETIEAEYILQDNKTQTYNVERAPHTLELFL